MIRPIIHDPLFLAIPSEDANESDQKIIADLKDTLLFHRDKCVGMAANMIGIRKNIIIVLAGFSPLIMVNPVLLSKKKPYAAQEGCLSLSGERTAQRFEEIEVRYLDEYFQPRREKYSGWIAQIIQHEMDHCRGILI